MFYFEDMVEVKVSKVDGVVFVDICSIKFRLDGEFFVFWFDLSLCVL